MLVRAAEWQAMISSTDPKELRNLCSLILDKTIKDTDMFQSGMTKIFFRAGMLAALESLRAGRLNELATIIQKNMRRRMAVKKYKTLREATIKIQTWWRGIMSKRLVQYLRREVSARRLQTAIRRYIQRKKLLDARRSITLFQARKSNFLNYGMGPFSTMLFTRIGIRGAQARKLHVENRTTYAAVRLQSLLRGV